MQPLPQPRPPSALVLTAHGSADPRSAAVTDAIADQIRRLRPSLDVRVEMRHHPAELSGRHRIQNSLRPGRVAGVRRPLQLLPESDLVLTHGSYPLCVRRPGRPSMQLIIHPG